MRPLLEDIRIDCGVACQGVSRSYSASSVPVSIRYLVGVAVCALAVGACGSGGDTADSEEGPDSVSSGSAAPGTAETDATLEPEEDDAGEAADSGESSDPETLEVPAGEFPVVGGATVTIGDMSYEFAILSCVGSSDVAGIEDALTGEGLSIDSPPDSRDTLQFWIQPPGSPDIVETAKHAIRVFDVTNDLDWNAGSSPFSGPITFEHSMITDWTRDGMTASGTALFIEENYAYSQDENAEYPEPESTEGTFEIECDE